MCLHAFWQTVWAKTATLNEDGEIRGRDGEQPPSKLPHHYCGVLPTSLSLSQIVGLSESTSDREERKTGEIYRQIHPQGSQLQPVSTLIQKPQHRLYRDALTKNKEEKRRKRNQERHTKTESERWRDFFHEWSMQQHVVEIAAST